MRRCVGGIQHLEGSYRVFTERAKRNVLANITVICPNWDA